VREIRMLRAMWRALETESRSFLNGHEGGNAGYSQGTSYGFTRQRSTLPGWAVTVRVSWGHSLPVLRSCYSMADSTDFVHILVTENPMQQKSG
jgi:hypothetical protein